MSTLNLRDFQYNLPHEKIALFPLGQRDQSKLLVSRNGAIHHATFTQVPEFLPHDAFLFFNDTKVIPARLLFQKDSGAAIEIFLLQPVSPSPVVAEAMQTTSTCTWQCTIGNLKRWTEKLELKKELADLTLTAALTDRVKGIVTFSWNQSKSFAEVVAAAGEVPLPPYLKRKAEISDKERYQTIYSHYEGAVAAPTAGLHFTEAVFNALKKKGISHDFITLHVSAGTFQPVKSDNINEHVMHEEQIVVSRKNLENLLRNNFIVPVGTTSMRTLESLYWYGVRLMENPDAPFDIDQDEPYIIGSTPSKQDAFNTILKKMDAMKTDILTGKTAIFIKPGYSFKICNALITNFHQPGSTLILLVAAFTGTHWRKIYSEALEKDYRFLSYGDSSLLFP